VDLTEVRTAQAPFRRRSSSGILQGAAAIPVFLWERFTRPSAQKRRNVLREIGDRERADRRRRMFAGRDPLMNVSKSNERVFNIV